MCVCVHIHYTYIDILTNTCIHLSMHRSHRFGREGRIGQLWREGCPGVYPTGGGRAVAHVRQGPPGFDASSSERVFRRGAGEPPTQTNHYHLFLLVKGLKCPALLRALWLQPVS